MALKTNLIDMNGLTDPLMVYNFDMIFTDIPGSSVQAKDLTVRCLSTSLPGKTIEPVVVAAHGTEVSFAGRAIWSKTLSVTMLETRDLMVRKAIVGWMNFAKNNRQGVGSLKAEYARSVEIMLFDDVPNVLGTETMFNCWPSSLEDLSLDGSQSEAARYNVTFTYDFTDSQYT